MGKKVLLLLCALLQITCLFALDWKKVNDGIIAKVDDGIFKLQICRSDIFRVLIYPDSNLFENKTPSVVKYDWDRVKWTVSETFNGISLKTSTNIIDIDNKGAVVFKDIRGNVLLAELLDGKSRLAKTTVLGEDTYRSNIKFISPKDESIYGLGQFPDGIMDFKDYFLNLRQFKGGKTKCDKLSYST